MAYTLEPNISHITKKLPKTSCVTVVVDEVVRINSFFGYICYILMDINTS